jgi:ABC-type multidrug transport system fused ATPase/permease subunit
MYLNISKLVLDKSYQSVLLFLFLAGAAFLQGVAISIIAPLIDITNKEPTENIFTIFFRTLLGSINLDVNISNILLVGLAISLVASFFVVISVLLQKKIQLNFEVEQKATFYDLLSNLKVTAQHQLNFGNVTQVIQQETKSSAMLIEYFVRMMSAIFQVAVYISLLIVVSMEMTLFVIAGLFILWFFIKRLYVAAKKQGRMIGLCSDKLQENFNMMLYGYKVLKSFVVYNTIITKQKQILAEYKKRSSWLAITESSLNSLFEPLALLIIIVAYSIHSYTVAELFVFTAAIIRLNGSMKALQNVHYKISHTYASLDRVNVLRKKIEEQQYLIVNNKLSQFKKSIRFVDLSFSYVNGDMALDSINFDIKKGSQVAFVGHSGAGKSTLVGLILGFYIPSKGKLLVDDTNLSTISMNNWLSRIGYVPQDPYMINATIRENVRFFRKIKDSDIISALKSANAWEFIEQLPRGLDSVMGELGSNLSGGQKQRISLARSLAGKPEILVLDEATSALDNLSEKLVKNAIEKLKGHVTVIIVAHRLTTIEHVDKIFVFDGGHLVEEGSYTSLMDKKDAFYRLAHSIQN